MERNLQRLCVEGAVGSKVPEDIRFLDDFCGLGHEWGLIGVHLIVLVEKMVELYLVGFVGDVGVEQVLVSVLEIRLELGILPDLEQKFLEDLVGEYHWLPKLVVLVEFVLQEIVALFGDAGVLREVEGQSNNDLGHNRQLQILDEILGVFDRVFDRVHEDIGKVVHEVFSS